MQLHAFDNQVVIQPKRFIVSIRSSVWPYILPDTHSGAYVLDDPNAVIHTNSRMIPSLDVTMYQPSFAPMVKPDAIQLGSIRVNMEWSKPMFRNKTTEATEIEYIDMIKKPLHVHHLGPKTYTGVESSIGVHSPAPESVLRLIYSVESGCESVHMPAQTTSGITTSTTEEMFRDTSIRIGSITNVTVGMWPNPFASTLRTEPNYTSMYIDVPLSWA
jgi:hypothetical protein